MKNEEEYITTLCLNCLEPYEISKDKYKSFGRGTCKECHQRMNQKSFKRGVAQ